MGSSVCCNLTQLDAFVLDSATPRYLCSGKRLGCSVAAARPFGELDLSLKPATGGPATSGFALGPTLLEA